LVLGGKKVSVEVVVVRVKIVVVWTEAFVYVEVARRKALEV
jgi:hypothetical protein